MTTPDIAKFPQAAAGNRVAAGNSAAAGQKAGHGRKAAAGRIDALQYLRALAALSVVIYHAGQYAALDLGASSAFSKVVAPWAVSGVAMFFALSGFLMGRIAPGAPPGRFLLHRLARIYPIFLVIVIAYMALSPLLAGQWRTPRLLAITLVPVGEVGWTLGGVEWTLLFETTFYVCVFVVIAAGLTRWLAPIAVLWLGVIVTRMIVAPHYDASLAPTLLSLPVASANIAFAGGLLAASLTQRFRIHPLFMLTPLLPIALWGILSEQYFRAGAGVAAAVMVAACLSMPIRDGWLHRAGLRLGDASYALYLIHIPLIIAVMRWAPDWLDWRVTTLLSIIACILVCLPFSRLDLNMYRQLRRRIEALSEPRALRLAWIYTALFLALGAWGATMEVIEHRQATRAAAPLRTLPTNLAANVASNGALMAHDALNAHFKAAGNAFARPRGAIDQTSRMPDGKIAVQGWAIDLEAPDAPTWIAVYCGDQQTGWASRTRLRRAEAAQLATESAGEAGKTGARDLAKIRFGFMMATAPAPCPTGAAMTAIATDARGRAHALPSFSAP